MELDLQSLDIYRSYKKSKYLSLKHSTYFHVYEELLGKYRGQDITFVEIGVLNGGSLFMWRDYFGPKARIIGIDFNPVAKRWETENFEIFIGSQSDVQFWQDFFSTVGPVDIVLDDGGHTNEQQIITTEQCVPHIRDGGLLIVEDVHTSYMKAFGNPSKYSFIGYCKRLVDGINSRFSGLKLSINPITQAVWSLSAYESIVSLRIDRRKCVVSSPTSNDGISLNAEDLRNHGSIVHGAILKLRRRLPILDSIRIVQKSGSALAATMYSARSKLQSRKLRKYFR